MTLSPPHLNDRMVQLMGIELIGIVSAIFPSSFQAHPEDVLTLPFAAFSQHCTEEDRLVVV